MVVSLIVVGAPSYYIRCNNTQLTNWSCKLEVDLRKERERRERERRNGWGERNTWADNKVVVVHMIYMKSSWIGLGWGEERKSSILRFWHAEFEFFAFLSPEIGKEGKSLNLSYPPLVSSTSYNQKFSITLNQLIKISSFRRSSIQ